MWLAIDRLGGQAIMWLFQHSCDITSPQIRHLVNNVDEDVILLGTSRCNAHYVPSIISDTLGMSVYNGGIDGSGSLYVQYMALCHILSHHTPKVVCLEVQRGFLENDDEALTTTSFFAPYFGRCPQADSVFRMAGTYWPYKLSHLYRYNARVLPNITGLFVNRWTDEDHGYVPKPPAPSIPILFTIARDSDSALEERACANENQKSYAERFVNLCRNHDIFLVFTVSPELTVINSDYYAQWQSIADRWQVPMLNYHSKQLFTDHPEYFHDNIHLWDRGARTFSPVFAHDLKALYNSRHSQ